MPRHVKLEPPDVALQLHFRPWCLLVGCMMGSALPYPSEGVSPLKLGVGELHGLVDGKGGHLITPFSCKTWESLSMKVLSHPPHLVFTFGLLPQFMQRVLRIVM
jgi:hypothetical protein